MNRRGVSGNYLNYCLASFLHADLVFSPWFAPLSYPPHCLLTAWTSAACFHTHLSSPLHFMSAVWTNITEQYSQMCVPPADTNKHSLVYYCIFLPRLFACGTSEAVTSTSRRDHSEMMQPPSPARHPDSISCPHYNLFVKACVNSIYHLILLPTSWKLPALEMPEANAHSAPETPECLFTV